MKLDDAFSLLNRVFLDTAPVIYYIERNPQYFPTVRLIFQHLIAGRLQAVTSPVTLAECLVKPIRDNLLQLQQDFVEVVTAGENTSFTPIDAVISRRAAELRVQYGLKLPDALQISIAITTGCDGFLTNDEQLKRVTESHVLILKELDLKTFLEHFDTIAEAPGGIAKLRSLILDLAVQGKLVPQNPEDEPANELFKKIQKSREVLYSKKKASKKVISHCNKNC